jgi:hypothetical protein
MNNDTFRSRYLLSKEEKQELKIINDKLKDLYSEIDKYLEN